MLANVMVYAPHLFMFDTLSKHSKTIRTEKWSSLYQETELGLIIQWGIWIPYCSNPHFSQHDSDKQRLRGGLVKCQRMTMRLLKLQPAIWINVQKDSTCFPPSSTEECWENGWEIDTSLAVICLSSAVKRRNMCGCHDQQDTFNVHLCLCKHCGTWCKHISTLDTAECPSGLWPSMPTQPPCRGGETRDRNTGMWIEDQWDAYFLGYVCMHSVHQVDSVINDALVAVFEQRKSRNIFSVTLTKPCPALVTFATSFCTTHRQFTLIMVAD